MPFVVTVRKLSDNSVDALGRRGHYGQVHWGTARRRLMSAKNVIVVRFSLPPTDFHAAWLLKSVQLYGNADARVFVVSPMNNPDNPAHEEFASRMRSVFPNSYNGEFMTFGQIGQIVEMLRE